MYTTNMSNVFNLIIVSAVLSVLVTDNDTTPSYTNNKLAMNTLSVQKNFRECINSSDSDAFCVKIIDELNLSIVSNNAF